MDKKKKNEFLTAMDYIVSEKGIKHKQMKWNLLKVFGQMEEILF